MRRIGVARGVHNVTVVADQIAHLEAAIAAQDELCHHIHGGTPMTLDIVVCRKPMQVSGPAVVARAAGS
jgi:hypothetical protein